MIVMTSMVELDELSNGENQVVSQSSAVTTADASDKCQQQQDSTSSTSTLATSISANGNFDLFPDSSQSSSLWTSQEFRIMSNPSKINNLMKAHRNLSKVSAISDDNKHASLIKNIL
ncbi:hypothetical protein Tco_0482042 [Tanacetum coccineum]